MGSGLWDTGLSDWYGPATPMVRTFRGYRPNRRGAVRLVRWARVLPLRFLACVMAAIAVGTALDEDTSLPVGDRLMMAALLLALASLTWRFSLVKVVLRPGRIVRFGAYRHTVVPVTAVNRLHRESFRGGLRLETADGEEIGFRWFDGSLWDLLYDFSEVCADAMRAQVRSAVREPGGASDGRVERRFTWSAGAGLFAAGAVASLLAGFVALVRG
ncbi:hypothetical protein [Streptomyces sp. NPDC060184]|uniref:hypothetical protein n=1 Tax=Streptomyces sp. NPDC060184 TaxID=3347064 RepID=UPI00365B04F1